MPVIEGRCPRTGDLLRVETAGDRIASVQRARTADATIPWLVPGFIDVQVNGYAGHDVNGEGATPDAVAAITHTLATRGVTSWVPTIITGSEEAIIQSMRAVTSAREQDPTVARAIPFVHVEGPFLSPEDGPRGAHALDQVRTIDPDEVARWAQHGPLGYVTVSPHDDEAPARIAQIAAGGVRVALGHTHASPEQLLRATDAGATLCTHLGNGIFATLPRHPNPIWTQLADDRLTAGFIGDGHHLPPDTLTAMVRAKGQGRRFLVSDSVALAGSAPGVYQQPVGGAVELHDNGRLTLSGTPLLAGSAVNLAEVVAYTLTHTPIDLNTVVEMVSETPARIIGDPTLARVQAGARADLLLLDPSGTVVDVVRQGARP
ncbi:N-acetylglucosamine-6-phosphate deacetylase [Propioniciclava sinopodophylli]|uniref:N-acetylglucosamine-6-phosphate deacetylase n=1 Tax=Propioniciclava sinopodophylli TaxID=1837344 RepID=A0A4Q9KB72_9ACTN|nr:amidohydrolase family protein [Propioniciclava sinopodophylli]TBT82987.1 N-acetylglucosamine-6-phosphate deacetylase [Propioniciclava sinopodophylli]